MAKSHKMRKVLIFNVYLLNYFKSHTIIPLFILRKKICTLLVLSVETTLKLYYRQPKFTDHDLFRYDVVEKDVHACQMITYKYKFPFNTIIKLYVMLIRSMKKIMKLLNTSIARSFTTHNHNHIVKQYFTSEDLSNEPL